MWTEKHFESLHYQIKQKQIPTKEMFLFENPINHQKTRQGDRRIQGSWLK